MTHLRLEQRLAELRALRPGLDTGRREWRSTRVARSMLGRVFETGALHDRAVARGVGVHLATAARVEQRFEEAIDQLDGIIGRLRSDTAHLGLVAHALQDEVMAVRLLPAQTVFEPFERTVRDLGRRAGQGGAPRPGRWRHRGRPQDPGAAARPAAAHGAQRRRPRHRSAGRARWPAARGGRARSRLTADLRGGGVEIEVEDDGRGLVPETLRRRAVTTGLLSPEQAAELDDAAAMRLIFKAGFTTSAGVTETSGRGVGMDVVHEHVARLGGEVRIQSTPGRGTRFTLSVPLTLATTRVVLVEQAGQLFAAPSAAVVRSGRVAPQDLLHVEGHQAVVIAGRPVPVVELGEVLERAVAPAPPGDARRPYLVLQHGERRLALLVDRLVGEQEIVVKSLGWPLRRVRNVSSAAVLGSGQIVMILNPADLLRAGQRLAGAGGARSGPRRHRPRRRPPGKTEPCTGAGACWSSTTR